MIVPFISSLFACMGVCPPGEAPGIVVVAGGDLQPVTFSSSTGMDHQLSYDAARLALWFDPARTLPALPLTTFQATGQIVHGDLNGDAFIDGTDFKIFVAVVLGVNTDPIVIAQADFDESGVADVADAPLFVDALLAPAGSPQNTVITLYAEGLTVSTDLCDTPVDLLADPESDGTFALADTAQLTVADLTISPQAGGLGTPVTITLTPAIAPLVFDATTTASWTGVFQPVVGNPSQSFTITFDANQFQEASSSQATVVLGVGSFLSLPDLSTIDGLGSLEGSLTLEVGGISLKQPHTFTPATDAITWESILYPDGPGGLDPPELGGEVASLNPWWIALFGMAVPSDGEMLIADGFHHAVVLRAEESPSGVTIAPATVSVNLVSFNQAGVEIDRVADLVLEQPPDDGDPAHIVYHNDLSRPVILVDLDLNKSLYPNVTLLKIEVDGSVVVAPSTN